MINVITLCSGYDSQCMALERLKEKYGLEYDLIAWSEIEKSAIIAHNAIFPQYKDRNIGDMTKADWSKINEKIDLLVYSTPCQSISNAGLRHGFKKDSGTRSSIIWSTLDAIDHFKPKYLLLENVKAIVSKKFIEDFKLWCSALEERGYTNFWKVLNAKDFGIPQNRERVFMVSVLGNEKYEFPEGKPLDKYLKDILEDKVDLSYYLKPKNVESLKLFNGDIKVFDSQVLIPKRTEYGKQVRKVYESGLLKESRHNMTELHPRTDNISNTLTTVQKDNLVIEPITCAMRGRNTQNPSDRTSGIPCSQRLEPGSNVANCLTTVQKDSLVMEPLVDYLIENDVAVIEKNDMLYTIRRLTPRESLRLMGVTESDIDKFINAGIAKTNIFNMAGNSIVVNVLYAIFEKLLIK